MAPTENSIPAQQDDEIDLLELWDIVWTNRLFIVGCTLTVSICAFLYSVSQTEIYRAEALLAPAETRQVNNPLIGQLGSAAGLVGINVGQQGSDQITTALAIIRSRQFIVEFIKRHNLLVPLMAGSCCDADGASVIDTSRFDESTGTWIGDPPTDLQAYNKFSESLSATQDQQSGLVTVAFEWHDPEQARDWVTGLVDDINGQIKEQDLREATDAIEYLQKQLSQTSLVDMQQAFYQLIESQTRIVMLADVRNDYVFRIIDPAVLPEIPVRPRVVYTALIATVIGFAIAVLFVLFRKALLSRPNRHTKQSTFLQSTAKPK